MALLRAVKTSAAYATIRRRLQTPQPDDVWYQDGAGWIITFALNASQEEEEVALFVAVQPHADFRVTLDKAMTVRYRDSTTAVRVLAEA